jgi:hypothetical protein
VDKIQQISNPQQKIDGIFYNVVTVKLCLKVNQQNSSLSFEQLDFELEAETLVVVSSDNKS